MKTVGIIAEYNPCHKGHAYHIEQAKKLTGSDCAVIIMSGNFVQRGMPAIADKFTRAHTAVLSGADLVIELPVAYSTSSAEFFAKGAVSILNSLGNIDYLSFGMEADSLNCFERIVDILHNEPDEYKSVYKENLRLGMTVPAAREDALLKYVNDELPDIITSPNNILAIEYLKALKQINSTIKPCGVKRLGNNYHDTFVTTEYPSATAIRQLYLNGNEKDLSDGLLPDVYAYLKKYQGILMPVFPDDVSGLINYALTINKDCLNTFLDIDDKLANRINNVMAHPKVYSLTELIDAIKTKNLTYTRISRAFIHVLLNIKKSDLTIPCYARILACNETGRQYIRETKKKSDIPFITDVASAKKDLSEQACTMLEKDLFASIIYKQVVKTSYGTDVPDDYRRGPEIL